jgi:hypothetical protein
MGTKDTNDKELSLTEDTKGTRRMYPRHFVTLLRLPHQVLWAALCSARNTKPYGYRFLLAVWAMDKYSSLTKVFSRRTVQSDVPWRDAPSINADFAVQELAGIPTGSKDCLHQSTLGHAKLHRGISLTTNQRESVGPRTDISPQGTAHLSNATILDAGNSILYQGHFLRGRWRERKQGITEVETEAEFHAYARKTSIRDMEPATIPGLSLCLAGPWSDNYFHWLLQYLPILKIASQFQPLASIDQFIVKGPVKTFQLESLSEFGIPAHKVVGVSKERIYLSESMLMSTIPCDNFTYFSWAIEMLRDLARPKQGTSRSVFFDRHWPTPRRMINSEEVYDILEEYGVTPVDCGKLNFKEQIDVAASSHLILGIHGASLANCVFSAPGSIMLELAPRNYQPVYFSKLTSACGLGYEQILGAESGPLPFQKPIYNADIIVPTKALRKSLARLTAK